MKYEVVENFWEKFYDLSPEQKDSVRRAWLIFKQNPFDARLRTHSINRLSSRYQTTIYSVVIEKDLRALFRIDGDTITTLDVGTHDLYK